MVWLMLLPEKIALQQTTLMPLLTIIVQNRSLYAS